MIRHAHKVGAVFYVLWGLLHVLPGAGMLLAGAEEHLDLLSTAPLPEAELPAALAPLVHAVADPLEPPPVQEAEGSVARSSPGLGQWWCPGEACRPSGSVGRGLS